MGRDRTVPTQSINNEEMQEFSNQTYGRYIQDVSSGRTVTRQKLGSGGSRVGPTSAKDGDHAKGGAYERHINHSNWGA